MIIVMRATLDIPDDVYEVVRSLSIQRNLSRGEALGEIVRGSLKARLQIDTSKDFPCFVTSENAEPITLWHTLELEDEW